jgi:hypothetical protein
MSFPVASYKLSALSSYDIKSFLVNADGAERRTAAVARASAPTG